MKKVISYLLLITIIFNTLSNYQQKYVDASVNNSYEAYAENTSEGMVYYIKDNGSSKVVYCFNHDKAQPPMLDSGTKLPQYTKLDYLISDDSSTVSSGVKKQIAAVLYAGYPNNAIELQEKYGLSDDKARYYTQDALWSLIRGDTWFGGQVYDYWSALMEYGLSNQYYGDGTINFNGEFKLINDGQIWKTNIISVEGTYKESIIFENLPEGMKIINADTNKEIINGLKVGEKFYLTYTGNEINKSPFNIKYKYQNIDIDFYKLISGTSEKDYQNLIGLNKKDAYKDISIEADKIDTSISISVNKIWEDDNSTTRPSEVEVRLYKDGQAYGDIIKLNDANSWKYQWSNLDSTYEWSVDEVNTPSGYIKSVTKNDTNFTITNKKIVGRLEITKKDSKDGTLLPNAGFKIYDENMKLIEEKYTNDKGILSIELNSGKYYYQEFEAPAGYLLDEKLYEFEITKDKEVISVEALNTKAVTISVEKVWEDDNSTTRPSEVEVQLYKDGKAYGDIVKLNDANSWKYQWSNLDSTYKWTVDEVNTPSGYTKSVTNNDTNFTITNKKIVGKLEITKTDVSDGKLLPNAGFRIYDENKNVIAEGRTDEKGLATFELGYGKYYYQEFDAPEGYVIDEKLYPFEIKTSGEIVKANMTNAKIVGRLEITKKDSKDGTLLPNAGFKIYDENMKLIEEKYTNDKGILSIELNSGKYYYQEFEAPAGYLLDEKLYEFEITKDKEVISVEALNTKAVTISVEKVWEDDNSTTRPSEVEVQLYKDGKAYGDIVKLNDANSWKYQWSNLDSTYKWTVDEVNTPSGYTKSVTNNDTNFTITNKKIVGKLEITKTDVSDGKLLPNAGFRIYDENKNVIAEGRTDEKGLATFELGYGKYYYQEFDAPEGYVIDEKLYPFEIKTSGEIVKANMTNAKIVGRLEITKKDSKDGTLLPNAGFKIYDENMKLIEEKYTNDKGILSIELNSGKYYYQEFEAPAGYLLDEKLYEFEITKDKEVISVEALNTKAVTISVEKVWEDDNSTTRPSEVEVQLYKDGKAYGDIVKLNDANSWKYQWSNLDSTYKWTVDEVNTPSGYTKSVTNNDTNFTITNKKIVGKLEITKTDVSDGKLLPNAGFRIYDENKNVIAEGRTDEKGLATFELGYGKYYYQEFDAPEGYVIDEKLYPFEIKTSGEIVKANMTNAKIVGRLEITKKDSKDGTLLPNAGFKIYDENMKLIEEKYTNDKGMLSIELNSGKYYYQEFEAPAGYLLDEKLYEFEITKDKEVISVEALNTKAVTISVEKVWEDDNSTTRPSEVEVQLYKDGKAYGDIVKLNDANSWKYQWSNLDSTYKWTVDEVNTPSGYTKSVTNNDTNFTITNKKIVGKLEITKTDVSDGKLLPNAGFRIYDENKNVIAEGRTDEKGLATFELGYGKYYYQEFDAPEGYVIDEKLYPFEIKTSGEIVKANMTNAKIVGRLEITKKDSKDGTLLPNAGFKIYDENMKLIEEKYTNDKGMLSIELNSGKYYYQEFEAPAGYLLDEKLYEFEITKDKEVISVEALNTKAVTISVEKVWEDDNSTTRPSEVEVQLYKDGKAYGDIVKLNDANSWKYQWSNLDSTYKWTVDEVNTPSGYTKSVTNNDTNFTITNKKIVGKLEITKTDVSDGKLLPNAGFRIYDENKNVVAEGRTDEKGLATFELGYGKYYYQEFDAPEGYVIDEKLYPFEIKTNGEIVKANMTNAKIVGKLEITKTDVADGKLLPNAGFRIYDENKNVIAEGRTDEKGLATFELGYGKYYYQEFDAPEGYVIDEKLYPFEIKASGEIVKANMTNAKIVGKLEITKTDVADGKLLPNAGFRIYDENKNVIAEGRTDEKGLAIFELGYGKYYYQEFDAPKGYVIDEKLYPFEIKASGEIVKANMTNAKIVGKLEITKTDVADGKLLPNAGFRIYDENKNVIAEGRTDEKGLAIFELGYGKYYYQEFDAPDGYVIDEKLYPFEIKTNGEIVKANMTNKKLEKTDKPNNNNTSNSALPNTGGTDTYLYMMLALLISFAGVRLFNFRYKNEK